MTGDSVVENIEGIVEREQASQCKKCLQHAFGLQLIVFSFCRQSIQSSIMEFISYKCSTTSNQKRKVIS